VADGVAGVAKLEVAPTHELLSTTASPCGVIPLRSGFGASAVEELHMDSLQAQTVIERAT
jgi:hypothetical protein